MSLETVYFPVTCTIAFAHSGIRKIAAHSLHSFKVQKFGLSTVNLTTPDGAIAYGVSPDTFERLPAGYVWVKFKELHILSTAKKDSCNLWVWQGLSLRFEADRFYALKILPGSVSQTDSCNFMTKDGKMIPYVNRNFFSVVSEIRNSTLPRVLEAFPLPVPGNRSAGDSDFWESPSEYDSIPVVLERNVDGCYKSSTVSPVAALRLDFDVDRNPLYRCSYFGPAPK